MVTDFEERLRKIREEKSRESEAHKRHADELAHERQVQLADLFERREQLERAIEQYSDKFMEVVPAFTRTKSFFEGKYKVEVNSDEIVVGDNGRMGKLFSRVTFLLDTQSMDGRIVVRCKKTVRNRDLETTSTAVERSPEALETFQRYAEQQFIEFAGAYFDGEPSAKTR